MIEQLFGSKTRVKLLQLFYSNPNRAFYVREITRKIDEQINSVRRELANLLSIGIIGSDTNNNRLYYEVDQSYRFYQPLSAIFGEKTRSKARTADSATGDTAKAAVAADTTGSSDMVKALRLAGKVELALLTGQFTRDERSGIDLLLVGDMNRTKLAHTIEELEAQEHKVINYALMGTDEYTYRLQVKDRFLMNVLASKKQVIINSDRLKLEP